MKVRQMIEIASILTCAHSASIQADAGKHYLFKPVEKHGRAKGRLTVPGRRDYQR